MITPDHQRGGLIVDLNESQYQKILLSQGGPTFVDTKSQQTLRIAETERLFPAIEQVDGQANVLRYSLYLPGTGEVLSHSLPLGKKLPESEIARVEQALLTLQNRAAEGRPEMSPKAHELYTKIRFPDPDKEPELYRVYKHTGEKRLAILFGVSRNRQEQHLTIDQLLHRLRAKSRTVFSLDPGLLTFAAALLLFLGILGGAWLYMNSDSKKAIAKEETKKKEEIKSKAPSDKKMENDKGIEDINEIKNPIIGRPPIPPPPPPPPIPTPIELPKDKKIIKKPMENSIVFIPKPEPMPKDPPVVVVTPKIPMTQGSVAKQIDNTTSSSTDNKNTTTTNTEAESTQPTTTPVSGANKEMPKINPEDVRYQVTHTEKSIGNKNYLVVDLIATQGAKRLDVTDLHWEWKTADGFQNSKDGVKRVEFEVYPHNFPITIKVAGRDGEQEFLTPKTISASK